MKTNNGLNEKMNKHKIAKDFKFIKFFKSRIVYILILILILIYLFQDDKILNEPYYLILIRYLISVGVIVMLFLARFKKYKMFYISEIKNLLFLDKIILLLGTALVLYVSQSILSIPLNFAIKEYSKKNSMEYHSCKITNVITTNIDKIHFLFLNRKYSRYFNVGGFTRKELINNYYLELGLRKSILNTYYLESMNLKRITTLSNK